MRALTASDRAVLIEAGDLDEAMAMRAAWAHLDDVTELVSASRTVLVHFDPSRIDADTLIARLTATSARAAASPVSEREETVPVRYDGEDLDEVAELLGVSAEEVVARHLAARWRVAFSGFAPGFGYAIGDDPLFDVPRRPTPRTRVPRGAVGLAGRFTAVYPRETPGGWQLIGHTDVAMWDLDREPPALLAPGVTVRFVRAERASITASRRPIHAGEAPFQPHPLPRPRANEAAAERPGGTVEVVSPGLQLLVQDRGRPGHADLGVSASGAADLVAMRDANRAVGNRHDAAVLENVGGARLRFTGLPRGSVAAVTGAEADLSLGGADGRERSLDVGVPFALSDGDELLIGPARRGWRSVIAVRGGFLAAPALGSVSCDTLAGLGPAPLVAGDEVALCDPRTAPRAVEPDPLPRRLPAAGETTALEITLGPRDDWFTAEAIRALTTRDWEVTGRSDRVGIRLHGSEPLTRQAAEELPSEGVVTGAIQVPADGQPVLFLADHPLTGGYPVIGAVVDRDLPTAAQLPPGARVRFRIPAGRG